MRFALDEVIENQNKTPKWLDLVLYGFEMNKY